MGISRSLQEGRGDASTVKGVMEAADLDCDAG
jgi:hypothetical protein